MRDHILLSFLLPLLYFPVHDVLLYEVSHIGMLLRRPNADVLLKNLDESISSLNRGQFLQLTMDGPQVNWNVLKLRDDTLVSENLSKTVNIGSCAQHVVHGL